MSDRFLRTASALPGIGVARRRGVARPLAVAACALLLACGSNSKSSDSSPPSLSNLVLSPQSATVGDGGGSVSVYVSIDFSDSGGDLAQIEVTALDSAGTQLQQGTTPLQLPQGTKTGTLTGHLTVSTAVAGSYTLRFRVIDAGGRASNSVEGVFVVNPQGSSNPYPTLTGLSPSSQAAGGPDFTLTVTGSGFISSSVVLWNGATRTTTFVSDTELQAQILAFDVASQGSAWVSVYNPPPGGGYSTVLPFTVSPPPQPGVTFVAQGANDMVWDPYQRKLYLSVPSVSATNPNTITTLDPFTGTLGASQFAGSEPDVLGVSDDGQFLYAGIDGAASVRRFLLPDLVQDIAIPLGRDPYFGAYVARDLQVAPAAPHTTAVTLGSPGFSPSAQGGVVIFDDATARTTKAPGGFPLYDSLQWGSDATRLYAANNESSSFDFYVLTVNASGVTQAQDYWGAFTSYGARIHFDPVTGLVYSDCGIALDPANGLPAGTYQAGGPMVPDSSLNSAFFVVQGYSGTTLESFDLAHFTPRSSLAINGLTSYYDYPRRLVRWGQDGVAFLTSSQVVLVRGEIVLPVSSTANPVPAIGSTAPSGATAGSGNFVLVVTGTGFVPGSAVQWNGSERTTRFVSATQLMAYIPGSDVASAGSAQLTVVNPAPGGGASPAASFGIGP